MTPIDKVFMLDVNQCLNKELRQEVRPNWSDHVLEVRPGHHSGVVRPIRHINHVWCHRSTVLLGPILPQPCHHIDGVNTGDLERVFCQTPRSSLCWCHSHTVLQISNSGRSRIPVYRESKDYIIGVLLVKSLLTVEEDVLIDKLVRISVQYQRTYIPLAHRACNSSFCPKHATFVAECTTKRASRAPSHW